MIVNPKAGTRREQPDLQQVADILRGAGWQLDIAFTQARGHAWELSAQAVDDGCEVVIACGGDGTINEVIQPLVLSSIMLGVIPKGTVNVFAREFRLPRVTAAVAKTLQAGRSRTLDVGRANKRYFLLWAGVGFDAQVIGRAMSFGLPKIGLLPYVASTIETTFRFPATDVEVGIDGQIVHQELLAAIVSNIRGYAFFPLSPSALPDDGWLDLHLFTGSGLVRKLFLLSSFLFGHYERSPGFSRYRTRRITFRSSTPLPFHVDGELLGTTPVSCEVVPQALKVILPL